MAAAMAHVDDRDTWSVHFRDTMVGGRLLNNPRMAELHAREAPDRVRELEAWGAVFDRTSDGRILQRPFGGHTYPRLAHVGDRTGLELIRTLQDRSVGVGVKVYQETIVTRLAVDASGVIGAIGYRRVDGRPVAFPARAIILATGRRRSSLRGDLELVGVLRRRLRAGPSSRCRAHRHGVRAVPPHGHGPPARRARPARDRSRARRGRHPPQRHGRALHVALPARGPPPRVRRQRRRGAGVGRRAHRGSADGPSAPARAVHPGQRRSRHLHRGQGRTGLAARRRLPGHQLPARRAGPPQAALDVRAVQGAGGRRHHGRSDGGRADDALHDGRHPRRRRHRRHDDPAAVRGRRGGGWPARLQPPWAATRSRTSSSSGVEPARLPRRKPPPGHRHPTCPRTSSRHRWPPSRRPSSGPAARTPTASTRSSRPRCPRSWASSAPKRTSSRPSSASRATRSAGRTSASAARAASTPPGTSSSSCATCSPSPRPSRAPPWSAPRAAGRTAASTTSARAMTGTESTSRPSATARSCPCGGPPRSSLTDDLRQLVSSGKA